jgi:hypothetical protein
MTSTDIFNSQNSCPAYSINLDWLELICTTSLPLFDDEIKKAETSISISSYLVLVAKGFGSSHYKNIWDCYLYGENVLTLHSDIRNEMILKKGSVKVQFQNHILYQNWFEVWENISQLMRLKIASYTRVDIALDTDDTYINLMNDVVLNHGNHNNLKLKMLGKAEISASRFVKKKHRFESFRVGSASSEKQISIYDKSKEILTRSHKEYIIHKWQSNHMDIMKTYRLEMRLKSGVLNRIRNFDISQLNNDINLLTILKSESTKFFHFRIDNEDKNISRKQDVDVYPKIEPTLTITKKIKYCKDGAYKAKLSIHNIVKDIIKNDINTEDVLMARCMNELTIKQYHLRRWYIAKLPHWIEKYKKQTFLKHTTKLIKNQ